MYPNVDNSWLSRYNTGVNALKIDITPIKEGIGQSLVRDENPAITWDDQEMGVRLDSHWQVHAEVVHTEAGYLLTGTASGGYFAQCDRCLTPVREEITLDFSECYVQSNQSNKNGEDADEECRFLEKDQIDLMEVLTEGIVLQLPMKHLCSPECSGLCSQCGLNLNEETCDCKAPLDPRLSKLGQLLETKGGGQNGQS